MNYVDRQFPEFTVWQSLELQPLHPKSNYENMIIPLGITAATGKEITINSEIKNLPSGIKVFIEEHGFPDVKLDQNPPDTLEGSMLFHIGEA